MPMINPCPANCGLTLGCRHCNPDLSTTVAIAPAPWNGGFIPAQPPPCKHTVPQTWTGTITPTLPRCSACVAEEKDRSWQPIQPSTEDWSEERSRRDSAERQVEAMRAALAPFAHPESFPSNWPDNRIINAGCVLGDLRRAKAALDAGTKDEPTPAASEDAADRKTAGAAPTGRRP